MPTESGRVPVWARNTRAAQSAGRAARKWRARERRLCARDVRVGQVERLELGHRLVEARDGAADLGPLEVDLCDAVVREALCGQRAGDIVGTAEDQLLELLALAQLLRHAAREVDLLEDEQLERRGDLARQRARDARLLGGDDLECGQEEALGRQRSRELHVVVEIQFPERAVRPVAQLARDRPREVLGEERHLLQRGKPAELVRNGAADLIGGKTQLLERGELGKLCGQRAREGAVPLLAQVEVLERAGER
mmetsp:Transcript_19861/g.63303  ORF Transcript_19861/g.63303 Transcript_19861/m.63303 type:complete len:252 (-) Transcript_19861:373-1128(-)